MKKTLLSTLFPTVLLISACSSNVKMIEKTEKKEVAREKAAVSEGPESLQVATGKVAFKKFTFRKADGTYTMNCGGKKRAFTVKDGEGFVYFPASYFGRPRSFTCDYDNNGEKLVLLNVDIVEFDYPKEKLNVPKGKVDYSKEDIKRIIAEKEIKRKIYLNSSKIFLFNRPFKVPLNSFITSHYGNQRLFNNKKKSQHLGNDLRAATGTKIPAANRGKVVYTGNLFFSGNIVVIDHGMNIFSIYGHLSKILVNKGSIVNQGDIVGLAGATGRVSGPHLHWGIKIDGSWIDGFSLVEASKQQFNM